MQVDATVDDEDFSRGSGQISGWTSVGGFVYLDSTLVYSFLKSI